MESVAIEGCNNAKMNKYVVINEIVFDIYESSKVFEESKRRFVIKMNSIPLDTEQLIDLLGKLLINKNHSKEYLRTLITIELPVSMIEQKHIQDLEFVQSYYPEFLV